MKVENSLNSMNPSEKEEVLYIDVFTFWRNMWIPVFVISLFGLCIIKFGNFQVSDPKVQETITFFTVFLCIFFFIGFLSLLGFKLRVARMDSTGLTLYSGTPGFRRHFDFKWSEFEAASIGSRDIKFKHSKSVYGVTGTMAGDVLILHLKDHLPINKLSEIKNLHDTSSFMEPVHKIKTNKEGTELWILSIPRGGFPAFIYALSNFVPIKGKFKEPSNSRAKRFSIVIFDSFLFISGIIWFYIVVIR